MSDVDRDAFRTIAAECPGFQARATARAITRYHNACFRPLGLTAEQFSLMVGIGAAEGVTLVELALSAGVDTTTLSRNIQNLEKRGWVYADGGRGRAGKRLSLTASGHHLLAEALPVWRQAQAELSRRLGNDQLQLVRRAMVALAVVAEPSSPTAPEGVEQPVS
ncbi:MarR family winged helix-turn-helix transcriptional regulator [Nitrospirillum viridazoti]|uniref:MarR family transcriptional regulator n=1 Tax=Nitrospirillum viridazoti CBAmc TaxID=1441467 RepID=A0A248JVR7_9PROT|nr:MarR family winged helix-turn-helix transcriptional regulator [Nitrospirillum amazonense]ASG22817.1 MarR family transcriptional regulator [Nitrospirillum amazonense CBAmc]TWB33723.1 DNA-binding MarR family transcriptional regulator [Nitrospirillum amazonense]